MIASSAAALAAVGDPASQKKLLPAAPEPAAGADPRHQRRARFGAAGWSRSSRAIRRWSEISSGWRTAPSIASPPQPIETIERAIVMLGNDGLRSVMAAALMQPIFQVPGGPGGGGASRFPEIVWEHAVRSAHAAIPHASLVERANPFAAELLTLDQGSRGDRPLSRRAPALRSVTRARGNRPSGDRLHTRLAVRGFRLAHRRRVAAFGGDAGGARGADDPRRSPRRRSGARCALAAARARWPSFTATPSSMSRASGSRCRPRDCRPPHLESMLKRLLRPHEDPRTLAEAAPR